jgi:hypothetical protein
MRQDRDNHPVRNHYKVELPLCQQTIDSEDQRAAWSSQVKILPYPTHECSFLVVNIILSIWNICILPCSFIPSLVHKPHSSLYHPIYRYFNELQ